MPIKEKGQNATQVANKDVSTTAPTDGQVLTYSSSAGDYVEVFISNTLRADFTIVNNALDTYFTGRLIT